MARPRPQFTPPPRIFNEFQTACRLGRPQSWLAKNRDRLEAEGLPPVDDLLGGRDADAIDVWLDKRSGLADARSGDDGSEWIEALNG